MYRLIAGANAVNTKMPHASIAQNEFLHHFKNYLLSINVYFQYLHVYKYIIYIPKRFRIEQLSTIIILLLLLGTKTRLVYHVRRLLVGTYTFDHIMYL